MIMEKTLTVKIISPLGVLFEGCADAVFLPGVKCPFEVLPGHAPIISTLEKGLVRVLSDGREIYSSMLSSGVVRVFSGNVTVCAEQ